MRENRQLAKAKSAKTYEFYALDVLPRPVTRNGDVFAYNRRSELAAAHVGTNRYDYAYDTIGNRQWSSANAVTNAYTANNLNQYTTVIAQNSNRKFTTKAKCESELTVRLRTYISDGLIIPVVESVQRWDVTGKHNVNF